MLLARPSTVARYLWKLLLLTVVLITSGSAQQPDGKDPGPTFDQDIAPIFAAHCLKCHGSGDREAGLDLRRRFTTLAGGDGGPAIVVGKPDESLLVEVIEDGLMPPEDEPALSRQQISLLRRWIKTGANIAGDEEHPLPESERVSHWAFEPLKHNPLPAVTNGGWVINPVDTLTLAALEQRQWYPASPASRRQLIRRITFDLTGLPPTPEQVDAFINDSSPLAYERLVDRLLASPRYGQRWGQHWLDVVRFAETEGFEYDRHLPDAWRFRDYVIKSLNDDKPFDRFVTEQIAGDEIAPDDRQCQTAAIFHRLGAVRRNAGNPEIALSRNEVLTERTNIIGEAFLGLSVGCARCHNHKLEPITQRDYYQLQAYLAGTAEHDVVLAPPEQVEKWTEQTESIDAEIKKIKALVAETDNDQKAELEQRIADLESQRPPPLPTIPTIRNDFENRTPIHVLRRGIWENKGIEVRPRPLSVLTAPSTSELDVKEPQPRTRLAEWLTHDVHPLTSRVIVNRIWQHHFGQGLVNTSNDFGTHGDPPSHPELLDWLARELIKNDWHLKPIHRVIVLSNTYRQSSRQPSAEVYSQVDPDNRLLWRFNRRRLSAEEIRDAMLAITGTLKSTSGGPSVMVPVAPKLIELLYKPSQWSVTKDTSEHYRRSVYLIAKRNLRLPFMEAFDVPTLQSSCPVRESSTHAPQMLELLNGQFANEMAIVLARRLDQECGNDPCQLVQRAFEFALGRSPTDRERELAIEFIRDQPLREFALTVFNLNGFLYVD